MGEEFDQTGMYAKERKARPLEVAVRLIASERESYVQLRQGLMDATVSRNLDPDSTLAVKVERKIAECEQRIESRAEALGTERRQFCKAERESDRWESPSCPEGWLCPESPTGVCEYEKGDWDCCDFCGDPGERK
jgi:hypothetical protein